MIFWLCVSPGSRYCALWTKDLLDPCDNGYVRSFIRHDRQETLVAI